MSKGAINKGYLKDVETGEIHPFVYNPENYSDSQGITYSSIKSPCGSYPRFQYTGTSERTFSITLSIFNNKAMISTWINFIENIKPKAGLNFNPAHRLIFAFGTRVCTCVCTNISRTFEEYDQDLQPTRLTLALSFVEVM